MHSHHRTRKDTGHFQFPSRPSRASIPPISWLPASWIGGSGCAHQGTIQWVVFYVWCLLSNIKPMRLTHVILFSSSVSHLICCIELHCRNLPLYLFILCQWIFGRLPVWAMMNLTSVNKTSVNMGTDVCWASTPGENLLGCRLYAFWLCRCCQTGFYSDIKWQPTQQQWGFQLLHIHLYLHPHCCRLVSPEQMLHSLDGEMFTAAQCSRGRQELWCMSKLGGEQPAKWPTWGAGAQSRPLSPASVIHQKWAGQVELGLRRGGSQ
jgi:hypothetical protein